MKIDLAEKSKELKEFVSQYETTMFLGDISSLMQIIRFDSLLLFRIRNYTFDKKLCDVY